MKTSDFDYDLPPELIAQEPLPERDSSRLMVLERSTGNVSHRVFRDLPSLLRPGDLVVLNDTRVVPARLFGRREETGGRIEVLLLEDLGSQRWRAFTKSGGKLRGGEYLKLAAGRARARLVERLGEEGDVLEIESREPVQEIMETAGYMPVPPYVRRPGHDPSGLGPSDGEPDALTLLDRERYQTTYARVPGAVAAPTAGLHFTERVFTGLEERGIERAFVTLHVGPGTFRPVKVDTVEEHRMDPESYEIPPSTAGAIGEARARGGRLVAVGTTVTRTLEHSARLPGGIRPGGGRADIFITPGHEFRAVDVLLTNFHLPKGTPLLLASAFARAGPEEPWAAGRDRLLAAYAEAVRERYRFFSYGDAMLIV
jgi:S-adenosylmethionine:tRNA ribosyltransferase-isomerase